MSRKKLDQFTGQLTPLQAAEGINAALANARQLADAASLMLENHNWAIASSLAILSIEESGKSPILRALALARSESYYSDRWKDYRSHRMKNRMWSFMGLVTKGANRFDDFAPLFSKDADHPALLDKIKQIGFYTDCLSEGHWSIPVEVIDEDIAKLVVRTANIFAADKHVTELEIELLVKHLKRPAQGPSKEFNEKALSDWYAEMQENGIRPKGENDMEKFIYHGIEI